jgi:hypothetical protein
MWLFDPNSPCIAILTRTPKNHRLAITLGNLFPVTRNLSHDGPRPVFPPPRKYIAGQFTGEITMLWTITIILLILWLVGFIGFHVLGAWIHLLLLVAVVLIILNLLSGRRAV